VTPLDWMTDPQLCGATFSAPTSEAGRALFQRAAGRAPADARRVRRVLWDTSVLRYASMPGTVMIHGAHVILYSKDADQDRAFFRDVLGYPSEDAGHGWLIFALPPAEIAVHPSDQNDLHELYFMCDDVHAFIAEMKAKNVACSPVEELRWGSLTRLFLPSGGKLGVYQPKHPSPIERARNPRT
jgi:hypothetical protein